MKPRVPVCCVSVCLPDAVVVNRYQLLKSINPSIELVVEMMLPQNVAYLAATTPVPGVDHKYLHLLSPAYISGSGEEFTCLCWPEQQAPTLLITPGHVFSLEPT